MESRRHETTFVGIWLIAYLPIAHRAVESCEFKVGVLVEADLPQFGLVLCGRLLARHGR